MSETSEPAPPAATPPTPGVRVFDDRVDAVVEKVAAALKKNGFKRSKRTFRREVDTKGLQGTKAIQIVEILAANAGGEGVLDVGLAVYWKDFVPLLTPWKTKPPAAPREIDGQVRANTGRLGSEGADHRYRLGGSTVDEEVAARVEKDVLERALPFLDGAVELSKLARGEVIGADPYLVVLAQARLGKKDDAQAGLAKIAAEKPKEYIVVASFAGRLKLKAPARP